MLGPSIVSEVEAQEPAPKRAKRFQCHHCQRFFARLEHLQRHERTHTREKPFACPYCDHRFTRSDLLVRHERLTHDTVRPSRQSNGHPSANASATASSQKQRNTVSRGKPDGPDVSTLPTPSFESSQSHESTAAPLNPPPASANVHGPSSDLSFATLLMAAEHNAHRPQQQDVSGSIFPVQNQLMPEEPGSSLSAPNGNVDGLDFEDSLQDIAAFMDNGPLSSYHFSSFISAEQPMPFFSPESFSHGAEALPAAELDTLPRLEQAAEPGEDGSSFSRYGSRLPSLQPEKSPVEAANIHGRGHRALSDLTAEDRQKMTVKLAEFVYAIPAGFQLPSRLALSRYIGGYVNGFHEHLPFLHIPTMSVDGCCVELILAMAAVGAQYCFEGQKAVELFHVSQAIAAQRIRQRDARLAADHHHSAIETRSQCSRSEETPQSNSISGCLGLPSQSYSEPGMQLEDLMQTAQALLLLMAMATWAKHREILREALAIQSVLATLVRDDGFKSQPIPEDIGWIDWVKLETTKRTKFIVFCFFNLQTIVYNIPSLILNSEIDLALPCNAAEFKAPTAIKWKELRAKSMAEIGFQLALRQLFSRNGNEVFTYNSSLGNYVLVHAVIQHIFFVRQMSRYRLDHDSDIPADDVAAIEHALRNWQLAWKRNPESSLDPMNPNGPVPFNSTALLRLAYIRLNVDLGPGRALDTRDPVQIANAFRDSPSVKRTPKLVRAVLHSAHALSIPVKIGIHLVAQTQTFMWSIQHSLCSLECAFLLSKWLQALSLPDSGPAVTPDEQKIATLVKTMLDETEFAMPPEVPIDSPAAMKYLSAGVLRVWAQVFRGAQTWAIVDVIGTSLNIYANMLEAG